MRGTFKRSFSLLASSSLLEGTFKEDIDLANGDIIFSFKDAWYCFSRAFSVSSSFSFVSVSLSCFFRSSLSWRRELNFLCIPPISFSCFLDVVFKLFCRSIICSSNLIYWSFDSASFFLSCVILSANFSGLAFCLPFKRFNSKSFFSHMLFIFSNDDFIFSVSSVSFLRVFSKSSTIFAKSSLSSSFCFLVFSNIFCNFFVSSARPGWVLFACSSSDDASSSLYAFCSCSNKYLYCSHCSLWDFTCSSYLSIIFCFASISFRSSCTFVWLSFSRSNTNCFDASTIRTRSSSTAAAMDFFWSISVWKQKKTCVKEKFY